MTQLEHIYNLFRDKGWCSPMTTDMSSSTLLWRVEEMIRMAAKRPIIKRGIDVHGEYFYRYSATATQLFPCNYSDQPDTKKITFFRKEFEKLFGKDGARLDMRRHRKFPNHYASNVTELAWRGYQSGAKSSFLFFIFTRHFFGDKWLFERVFRAHGEMSLDRDPSRPNEYLAMSTYYAHMAFLCANMAYTVVDGVIFIYSQTMAKPL